MQKNGFIATSILYSFFLIFITLFVALITNYLHNQALISSLNEASLEILKKINNTRIADLNPGDYVRFANNSTVESLQFMNEDSNWVVAYIEENGNSKKYYFFSDLNTPKSTITYQLSNHNTQKNHSLSIDVAKDAFSNESKPYNKSLKFSSNECSPEISISFVTSDILAKARNKNYDDYIADAIFGTNGSYVVEANNEFYYLKEYTFNANQSNLLSSYCGGTFTLDKVDYNYTNIFGYMHIANNVNGDKYVDYCLYASSISYIHNASDHVVKVTENVTTDKISDTNSSQYSIRLMAMVTVDKNANSNYIAGGRGTSMDPYLITDGRKVG